MKTCIFCQKSGDMTAEHIFPKFLLKRVNNDIYLNANENKKDFKNNRGQTLKKVCATCNNEHLSKLDDEVKEFFESIRMFDQSIKNINELIIPINLKKWVFKVAVAATETHSCKTFITQEMKRDIIDPNAVLNNLSLLIAVADVQLYNVSKGEAPILFFDVKIASCGKRSFIKILIGQLAFVIFPKGQAYLPIFGSEYYLVNSPTVKISKILSFDEYLKFLSKAAFQSLVYNYELTMLRLEMLLPYFYISSNEQKQEILEVLDLSSLAKENGGEITIDEYKDVYKKLYLDMKDVSYEYKELAIKTIMNSKHSMFEAHIKQKILNNISTDDIYNNIINS